MNCIQHIERQSPLPNPSNRYICYDQVLIESLSCRHVTIHNFCIPEKPFKYASNEIEFDDALFRDPVQICLEWGSQFATLYSGTESTHYDRM